MRILVLLMLLMSPLVVAQNYTPDITDVEWTQRYWAETDKQTAARLASLRGEIERTSEFLGNVRRARINPRLSKDAALDGDRIQFRTRQLKLVTVTQTREKHNQLVKQYQKMQAEGIIPTLTTAQVGTVGRMAGQFRITQIISATEMLVDSRNESGETPKIYRLVPGTSSTRLAPQLYGTYLVTNFPTAGKITDQWLVAMPVVRCIGTATLGGSTVFVMQAYSPPERTPTSQPLTSIAKPRPLSRTP